MDFVELASQQPVTLSTLTSHLVYNLFCACVIWSDVCQLDFCGGSAQRRARMAYGYRGTGVHRYFCLFCSRMDPLIP